MSKPIHHQPHLSEDANLNGSYYHVEFFDLLERRANFIDYPETRQRPPQNPQLPYQQVFPDEFVGTESDGSGDPKPNDVMPDPDYPERILGGTFVSSGSPFDVFLLGLQQRCRNYNLDLFNLRQRHFGVKKKGDSITTLPPFIAAFEKSADELSAYLAAYDPRVPGSKSPFDDIAVEFIKTNGYIASLRAGADRSGGLELQFSSSSHVSLPSMFARECLSSCSSRSSAKA